jgi:response regulator of citrate/malate metabolism
MKKVLLIEDHQLVARAVTDTIQSIFGPLGFNPGVLVATTLLSAEIMFKNHQNDTDIILVDTHLDRGGQITTIDLVRQMKKVFTRPIIGMSAISEFERQMMEAGCTHWCNKKDLFLFIKLELPRIWDLYRH